MRRALAEVALALTPPPPPPQTCMQSRPHGGRGGGKQGKCRVNPGGADTERALHSELVAALRACALSQDPLAVEGTT